MQQVTKLAAHILRPLHAGFADVGPFLLSGSAGDRRWREGQPQHQNCKNRQPFSPAADFTATWSRRMLAGEPQDHRPNQPSDPAVFG